MFLLVKIFDYRKVEGNTAITPVKNENKLNNAMVKCVIIHLFYNFKNFYIDDLLYKNTTDFTLTHHNTLNRNQILRWYNTH